MVATGICHTDLKAQDGSSIVKYPVVLGHEGLSTDLVELSAGAGVVKEVGKDVKRCQVGDKVLLSFNSCGECKLCQEGVPAYCKHCLALNFGGTRLDGSYIATWKGKPLHANFFGQSSMSRVSIVSERSVPFPKFRCVDGRL
jgi:aryl-alcohol dehydrogenase